MSKLATLYCGLVGLRNLLEESGYTYHLNTLKRRLLLLPDDEFMQVRQCLQEIDDLADKIDIILSTRAALEKDPWP